MTAVARAISVEFGSDFEEPFQAEDRQVGGLGKVLAGAGRWCSCSSRAARACGVAEVDREVRCEGGVLMPGKLGPLWHRTNVGCGATSGPNIWLPTHRSVQQALVYG